MWVGTYCICRLLLLGKFSGRRQSWSKWSLILKLRGDGGTLKRRRLRECSNLVVRYAHLFVLLCVFCCQINYVCSNNPPPSLHPFAKIISRNFCQYLCTLVSAYWTNKLQGIDRKGEGGFLWLQRQRQKMRATRDFVWVFLNLSYVCVRCMF